jgi:glycosyltransferase involved in cell wall biosynthesis
MSIDNGGVSGALMHAGEKVNVVMSVYNEERTLEGVIRRVLAQRSVDRLLVIDDHSSDGSLGIIKRWARRDGRISWLSNAANRGKGYSVGLGLSRVEGGIVIIQDADEEYYPEDYPKLLAAVSDKHPVFGYRKVNYGHTYFFGMAVSRLHTMFFNLLFKQSVKDVNSGYKVFEKAMLGKPGLRANGFEIDMEIAARLARNGYGIRSVPIRYKGRTFGEGKKIGAGSAIGFFFYLLKERLS